MIPILTLTFVTIVEQGTITRAADKLNLAKSAISQNLKRLEQQLGVKLAIRTTRQFHLTPAGERYYQRCQTIIALSKKAVTEMENFGASPSGPITITAPHAMIAPIITPAISKTVKQYPLLRPSIIADDKRLDLINEKIDVSITVGALADSNLKATRVGILRDLFCATPLLLKEYNIDLYNKNIDFIQTLPYIAHSREEPKKEHLLTGNTAVSSLKVRFNPVLFGNTIHALTSFAKAGLGVALLPNLAISNDIKNGSLIDIFPQYHLAEKNIYAIHTYDTMPPKSVVAIIDAIKHELKSTL